MTSELVQALIHQVQKAAAGDTEQNVVTFISRPMWRKWNTDVGDPPDCEPTGWIGNDTCRVFGSKTVVVEHDSFFAVSTHI